MTLWIDHFQIPESNPSFYLSRRQHPWSHSLWRCASQSKICTVQGWHHSWLVNKNPKCLIILFPVMKNTLQDSCCCSEGTMMPALESQLTRTTSWLVALPCPACSERRVSVFFMIEGQFINRFEHGKSILAAETRAIVAMSQRNIKISINDCVQCNVFPHWHGKIDEGFHITTAWHKLAWCFLFLFCKSHRFEWSLYPVPALLVHDVFDTNI